MLRLPWRRWDRSRRRNRHQSRSRRRAAGYSFETMGPWGWRAARMSSTDGRVCFSRKWRPWWRISTTGGWLSRIWLDKLKTEIAHAHLNDTVGLYFLPYFWEGPAQSGGGTMSISKRFMVWGSMERMDSKRMDSRTGQIWSPYSPTVFG